MKHRPPSRRILFTVITCLACTVTAATLAGSQPAAANAGPNARPPAASSAAPAIAPSVAPAGTGCPAGMQAWVPSTTALASGNPQAVAPASLSAGARAAFGAQVLRMLAGHHVRWLGSTGCVDTGTYVGRPAASHGSTAGSPGPATARAGQAAAPPASTTSHNWSGYESDAGSFTGASMVWKVPATQSATGPFDLSIWPGIGQGSPTDLLIQAGTQQDPGGISAWTEVFPTESSKAVSGMSVAVGDTFATYVSWDKPTSSAAFLLVDYTTGVGKEVTQPVNAKSGSSAEWIAERGESANNTNPHLPNFGTMQIVNGAAQQTSSAGITTSQYIGAFNSLSAVTMTSCAGSPALATPTPYNLSAGTFTDTFNNAGPVDAGGCAFNIVPANTSVSAAASAFTLRDSTAGFPVSCGTGTGMTFKTSPTPVSYSASYAQLATVTGTAFAGCTGPASSTWSLTQPGTALWTLGADNLASDGSTIVGDITDQLIELVEIDLSGTVAGASCKFAASGTIPAGDVTYSNPRTLTISAANMTVSNVTGTGCAAPGAGIKNGDKVTISATYLVITTGGLTITPKGA